MRPASALPHVRAAPWPARLDIALALAVLATLVALAAFLPPRPFGDAPEYLLMAESLAAHAALAR